MFITFSQQHSLRTLIAAAVLIALFGSRSAHAQQTVMLPPAGPSTSGLRVELEPLWVQTLGYLPLQVTITSTTGPVTADRSLEVEISKGRSSNSLSGISQHFVIPEGKSSTTGTMLLPTSEMHRSIAVDVWEDGRRIKDLHRFPLPGYGQMSGMNNRTSIGVLIAADTRDSGFLSPHLANLGSNSGMISSPVTSPLTRLPKRWIDYSGLDVVCMYASDLPAARSKHPEVLQAIQQWVKSGGNLWIIGTGTDWSNLPEVHQSLGLAALDERPPALQGWTSVDSKHFEQWRSGAQSTVVQPFGGPTLPTFTPRNPIGREPPAALLRPLGMGMICAIALEGESMHPDDPNYYAHLLGSEQVFWPARHGLVMGVESRDFWNFLIPGVGLPPVTAFQLLITMFAIVIGPVNFYVLRHRNQLKLLLFTVPAGALLISTSLFAYAVLSDGFDIQVRARAITRLDQSQGEAVTWSRQSYYAGVAPSQPMKFTTDMVVYPLESESQDVFNNRSSNLRWEWTDREQRLSGWLTSRNPMQIVTTKVRRSPARLDFIPAADGAAPTVANKLGCVVKQLFLIDPAGNYYTADTIENGQSKLLTPATPSDVRKQIAGAFRESQLDGTATYASSSRLRSSMYYQYSDISQSTSMLETQLDDAKDFAPHGPRSYLAVVDRSPEVTFGLDDVVEKDSFHIIVGSW